MMDSRLRAALDTEAGRVVKEHTDQRLGRVVLALVLVLAVMLGAVGYALGRCA